MGNIKISNKNKKSRRKQLAAPKITSYTIFSDSLGFFAQYFEVLKNFVLRPRPQPVLAVVLFCLVSFFVGVGITWTTKSGEAQVSTGEIYEGQVLGVTDTKPLQLEDFVNTTISKLSDYLEEKTSTESQLMAKKELVKKYLEYKNSPFAKDDAALDTLVHTPHMKIMLEIAFAESTLGKKCVDNNCSNIGSAPDRPYWREYKSLSNWILDFNRLLERRYKDQTLKEMCGVYVQPCTDSWLAATGQISRELAEWGIE